MKKDGWTFDPSNIEGSSAGLETKLYFTFVLLARNKFYNTNTCGQIFEPSIHFEAEFLSQN